MAPLDTNTWLLLGVIAGIVVLVFLYVLAAHYRHQTTLHDLKLQVQVVRREFAERLAREREQQILVVAPVKETGHGLAGSVGNNSMQQRAAA